jgi:hypothetical protein
MDVIYCPECLSEVNEYTERCPDCGNRYGFVSVSEEEYDRIVLSRQEDGGSPGSRTRVVDRGHSPEARRIHSSAIAISSAKLVNAYGTYIQVIGILIGIVIAIAGFWLAKKVSSPAYAVGGVLIGALDIAIFAVQGALFRMFSNYIIARLSE